VSALRLRLARLVVDGLFIASRPVHAAETLCAVVNWCLLRVAMVVDRWGGDPEAASRRPPTLGEWLAFSDES
jgi:hypothetical protein